MTEDEKIYDEKKMKQKIVYPTEQTPSYADWALFEMGKELEGNTPPTPTAEDVGKAVIVGEDGKLSYGEVGSAGFKYVGRFDFTLGYNFHSQTNKSYVIRKYIDDDNIEHNFKKNKSYLIICAAFTDSASVAVQSHTTSSTDISDEDEKINVIISNINYEDAFAANQFFFVVFEKEPHLGYGDRIYRHIYITGTPFVSNKQLPNTTYSSDDGKVLMVEGNIPKWKSLPSGGATPKMLTTYNQPMNLTSFMDGDKTLYVQSLSGSNDVKMGIVYETNTPQLDETPYGYITLYNNTSSGGTSALYVLKTTDGEYYGSIDQVAA